MRTANVAAVPEQSSNRRVVFVVGSGRSGTSTMSGALKTLGMHVPQPEVAADATNPRGFGEPQWVVDFHTELLQRCHVQVSDARPSAWFESGRAASFEPTRERLHAWLEEQLTTGGPELVVKDPRLAWFLGLWRSAAIRSDASAAYVTMLRHPAEVVGSKQKYYPGGTTGRTTGGQGASTAGEIQRTAAWINMMLGTERATRGATRTFVRYSDLLDDWTIPLFDIGRRFDLVSLQEANANHVRAVHAFIDPSLRRVATTWDDLAVPARLRDLAQATWDELDPLAGPDPDRADSPGSHARLDELRTAYAEMYAEAEAIAASTTLAAKRDGLATLPEPVNAVVRRGADRVPHSLRAMVPAAARQRVRKAIGRAR